MENAQGTLRIQICNHSHLSAPGKQMELVVKIKQKICGILIKILTPLCILDKMGFNHSPNLLVFKPGLNLNGFQGKRIVTGYIESHLIVMEMVVVNEFFLHWGMN